MEAVAVAKLTNRVPGFEVTHVRVADPSVAAIMVAAAVEEGQELSRA